MSRQPAICRDVSFAVSGESHAKSRNTLSQSDAFWPPLAGPARESAGLTASTLPYRGVDADFEES